MGKSRAIMTDTERERLAGLTDVEKIRVYQAKSRVRRRIEEELTFDVDILAEHHPELLEELQEVVCSISVQEKQGKPQEGTEIEAGGSAEVDDHPTPEPEETDIEQADSTEKPDLDANPNVRQAVEEIASSWQDNPARLEKRKEAAVAVLSHAIETGYGVGKTDAIDNFYEEFQVAGQNEETWWRKNVRPVLKEYGNYSQGSHGYIIEDFD